MGALLLGAVFAKVISTASNYLFSPATNLVNDVFVRYIAPGASNKRVLIVSRLAVVLLGCWALYQAVYAESILEKMLWAYTVYSAALTPVVLAAFYSKRVTAWGAVAAIGAPARWSRWPGSLPRPADPGHQRCISRPGPCSPPAQADPGCMGTLAPR
jgi:SSS family solute:Na+ symporter